MTYTLMKISPNGIHDILGFDLYLSDMISAGEKLRKIYPDLEFGITDQFGVFVWES